MNASFILPIRNEKEYISATLNTILFQKTQENYEILISDGGSTDGTLEIINTIILNNSNVHLIDNPQKMVSTGFNLALNKAKGDIIIRVDGHSEIQKNYLEKCCNLLKETDADIVGELLKLYHKVKLERLFLLLNHLRLVLVGSNLETAT